MGIKQDGIKVNGSTCLFWHLVQKYNDKTGNGMRLDI